MLFTSALSLLLPCVLSHYSPAADQIKAAVSQDITSLWTYKDSFPDMMSLKLNDKSVEAGLHYDGARTRLAIINMFKLALEHKNINMFVLGGSVTAGGDLGANNQQLTYHYALADWWNKTIGSITGSHMVRKVVAIGGVGTTYFGHCWQEYVNGEEAFDFASWEFAINDPDSLEYDSAVERFVRSILSMPSDPGMIFVNFASKYKMKSVQSGKCRALDDTAKVIDFVAEKYSTSSIRWERVISNCQQDLDVDSLFVENHPTNMGHAQVAYILISYFRNVIMESMSATNIPPNPHLPGLLFLSPHEVRSPSRCFTSMTPGHFNSPKHNIADLQITENTGFTLLPETSWSPELRYDSTGGFDAKQSNSRIKFNFDVVNQNSVSRIYITIRAKPYGGKTTIILNEGSPNQQLKYIDASQKYRMACFTMMIGTLPHGKHTLTVKTIGAGCNLCAIIID
eukprot:gene8738-9671_t